MNTQLNNSFNMFIETEVPENELIISRTSLKGIITYANDTFAKISGYSKRELVGKPHNIVRHPDMPRSCFQDLWDTIKRGETWNGYVKNLRKDGGYYWVFAEVSGYYKNGRLIEYKSLRIPVDRDKKIEMQFKYDKMREEEDGIYRITSYLPNEVIEKIKSIMELKGVSYDEALELIVLDML